MQQDTEVISKFPITKHPSSYENVTRHSIWGNIQNICHCHCYSADLRGVLYIATYIALLYQLMHSLGFDPMTFVLLVPCSTV